MRKSTYSLRSRIFLSVFFFFSSALFAQGDTDSFEPVGHFGGGVNSGAARDTVVFLAQGTGVSVFQIENASVKPIARIPLPEEVLSLQAADDHLYAVLKNNGGFYVIDVQDPAQPDTLGSCPAAVNFKGSVAVDGQRAYVATPDNGLQIIDISDPAAPVKQKTLAGIQADFVTIVNGTTYMVLRMGATATFAIYDLADPLNPALKSETEVPYASAVTVGGNFAYISCENQWQDANHGLRIYNVSDPTHPAEQSYLPTPDPVYSAVVDQNHVYLGTQDSLLVVNAADPTAPQRQGAAVLPDGNNAKVVGFSFNNDLLYAFVNGGDTPLVLFDVADPGQPALQSDYTAPDIVASLCTHQQQLYLSSLNELLVYDLHGVEMPAVRKRFPAFPGLSNLLFVNNTLLAVNEEGTGVVFLDVSDPDNLTEQSTYSVQSGLIGHFIADENRAYIKTGARHLEIVDISDPARPALLGSADLVGRVRDFALRDTLLFSGYVVNTGDRGVGIYSVAAAQQPVLLHTLATAGTPNALLVDGDTLYVGGNTTRSEYFVQLFGIADPAAPTQLAEIRGTGKLWDLEKRGEALLAAVEGSGVVRLEFDPASGTLQKTATAAIPGSQQITTSPPDAEGNCLLIASEGVNYNSPTTMVSAGILQKASSVQGSETGYGSYGVQVKKFKIKRIPGVATLSLSRGTVSYEPLCPDCVTEEQVIARLTLTADEKDGWQVDAIQFKGIGSGREDRYVDEAVLYVNGQKTDSKVYLADNGTISMHIGRHLSAGESMQLKLTYIFCFDSLRVSEQFGDFGVVTRGSWVTATQDQMPEGKILPQQDLTCGNLLVAAVENRNTKEYFGSIQEALDDPDTRNGDLIVVCPGIYKGNIFVSKSVNLASVAGRDKTFLKPLSSVLPVVQIEADGVRLHGFTISDANHDSSSTGVLVRKPLHVPTTGGFIYGNRFRDNTTGVRLQEVSSWIVYMNEFVQNHTGLCLEKGASQNVIGDTLDSKSGNLFRENRKGGILVQGAGTCWNYIAHNTIVKNRLFGITLQDSSRWTQILSNTISEDLNGILIQNSSDNTIRANYISDSEIFGANLEKNATRTIISENEFTANQFAAISASEKSDSTVIDGNTIRKNSLGIFMKSEEEVMNDPIIRNNTIFWGEDEGIYLSNIAYAKITRNKIYGNQDDGIEIEYGFDISIQDNTIYSNHGCGVTIETLRNDNKIIKNEIFKNNKTGIQVGTFDKLTVEENAIFGNHWSGIDADHGDKLVIRKNAIERNVQVENQDENAGINLLSVTGVIADNLCADSPAGPGMSISESQSCIVSGNTIRGNKKDGVWVTDKSSYVDIRSNQITRNGFPSHAGVHIDEKSNIVTVRGNTISDNCKGIVLEDAGATVVLNNRLHHNQCSGTGIHLLNSRARIAGNSITAEQGAAIHCEKAAQPTIFQNKIRQNEGDGILSESGSTPRIRENILSDNSGFGVRNTDPTVSVLATGNWWGDASGPGGAGSGNGEEISANVIFSDWLTQPPNLTLSTAAETLFVVPGGRDSLFCAFRKWQPPFDDALHVQIEAEDPTWLCSSTPFTVQLTDSIGADTTICLAPPAHTANGTLNRFRITATSQTNPALTVTDSFVVIAEEAYLTRISVSPDSQVVPPGATVQFLARGLDQRGRPMAVTPLWHATAGTIDRSGRFTADSTEGTVTITATDSVTHVTGRAVIRVSAETRVLTRLVVTPDSVRLQPGQTARFQARAYDQFDFVMNVPILWQATGGTISTDGYYTAGDASGLFEVTASDTAQSVTDKAVVIIETGSGVAEATVVPNRCYLEQNYPNPFNPSTTLSFGVNRPSHVELRLYDLTGREVRTLLRGHYLPGRYQVTLKAGDLGSGIYFVRIQIGKFEKTRKIVLLK